MSDNLIITPGQKPPQQPQMPNLDVIGQIIERLGSLGNYLQQIEQGVINMSNELQAQGLGFQMVLNMFLDKGIYTQEEIDEMHKKSVREPMEKRVAEIQQQVKAAQEAAGAQQNQVAPPPVREIPEPVVEAIEPSTEAAVVDENVVLASEQTDNVIRFPSGKKE